MVDYYRVLNVPRHATAKEIKAAYLRLAKRLHPDVNGNDPDKAELFKHVSEAHAVLSDTTERRRYDASRPPVEETAGGRGGGHATMHPYATAGPSARRSGPLYGIDEEVWLAHHYGPAAAARVPGRRYGMHIVEERLEREQERVERMTKHYKLHSSAGYFLRRDARLRREAEEAVARRKKAGDDKDPPSDSNGCIIS